MAGRGVRRMCSAGAAARAVVRVASAGSPERGKDKELLEGAQVADDASEVIRVLGAIGQSYVQDQEFREH
jgi:hypothetical protein